MKNKLKITMLLLTLSTIIFAQGKFADRLIQRNGKVIVCQVREIGDDEIKYIMDGYRDDLLFGIDKNKVEKIVFADGREMDLSDSMFGRESYAQQHKNALKFHFFSPLSDATAFTYERSLKPGRSLEATVGIVGIGWKLNGATDASGFYTKLGYKFIKDPDFYIKGMRYAHILKGAYIRPELAYANYSFTEEYSSFTIDGKNVPYSRKSSAVKGAFIINVGKQWVYSDLFVFDWYVGAGYGFADENTINDPNFGFVMGNHDHPLVLNAGFRIGLLF
ncbi:MAG: hypothetical protein ACM3P1_06110 [Candidatus Saccharibacteria bacterium]